MAGKKANVPEAAPPQTLEQARQELGNVREARLRFEAELAGLAEARDAALEEERRQHDEALRAGRPAKPSKKIRDLATDRDELERQIANARRLEIHLEVEALTLQLEEVAAEQEQAGEVLAEKEERLVDARRERDEAHNVHLAHYHECQDLQRRIRDLENRLGLIDPEFQARTFEERRRGAASAVCTPEQIAKIWREMAGHYGLARVTPEQERRLRNRQDPSSTITFGPEIPPPAGAEEDEE